MDPIYILIACVLTAWLFARASWTKLQSPLRTIAIVDNYQILPFKASTVFIRMLSLLEMMIALMILLPFSRQWGGVFAMVMLSAYGIAITINLLRGRTDFDCGCAGPAERKTVASSLIWRNAVLVLIAALAAAPMLARTLHWMDYTVMILAATFFILIYQVIENLLANHPLLAKL